MKKRILTIEQAIRHKCIECSGGSKREVKECDIIKCPLWCYRLGKEQEKEI